MSQPFQSVNKTGRATFKISGSEFLSFAFYTADTESFTSVLDTYKRGYPDATHHCYAWRINPFNPEEFSQDDGEPSGTAGQPILNVLKSGNFCNTGIIVVRYYGGTKLGKPGLIESYSRAASLALEDANLGTIEPGLTFDITLGYPQKKQVDYLLQKNNCRIDEAVYLENITYSLSIPETNASEFLKEINRLHYTGVTITESEQSVFLKDE